MIVSHRHVCCFTVYRFHVKWRKTKIPDECLKNSMFYYNNGTCGFHQFIIINLDSHVHFSICTYIYIFIYYITYIYHWGGVPSRFQTCFLEEPSILYTYIYMYMYIYIISYVHHVASMEDLRCPSIFHPQRSQRLEMSQLRAESLRCIGGAVPKGGWSKRLTGTGICSRQII